MLFPRKPKTYSSIHQILIPNPMQQNNILFTIAFALKLTETGVNHNYLFLCYQAA